MNVLKLTQGAVLISACAIPIAPAPAATAQPCPDVEVVSNPNWVARPSAYARSHEAGRSVDVTIAGADMGTGFDLSLIHI